MKKNYFLIGTVIVILGLIIISNYILYFNKAGEQITRRGIFLSSCNLENYDECISRMDMKSGPVFKVCWNNIKTFEESEKNPGDCIVIVSLLNPENISDKQLQEFKNYLNKEVKITGSYRSIKWGTKGENCYMTQIGCERDITVFYLKKIELISE